MPPKINLDEAKVVDMYVCKKMSSNEIGKIFNCSAPTITKILKNNKIKFFNPGFFNIGKPSATKKLISKKDLIKLYLNENKNASEIGRIFNCSHITILNKLKTFNIPRKSLSEAMIGKYTGKNSFNYGRKASKKTRRKLSESHKGKPSPMKDKRHKESSKKKMREANLGKKHSQQTRIKMSGSSNRLSPPQKDKTFEEYYGIEKATEIKNRMSASSSGEKSTWYGKKLHEDTCKKISKWRIQFYKDNPQEVNKMKERRKHQIFPKKDSSIEVKIQEFLKQLEIPFLKHQYMKIEHGYQCDIFIPSMNLVIEADGDYWHGNSKIFKDERLTERIIKQRSIDKLRTEELIEKGFNVLRLWEHEIKAMNINEFVKKIPIIKQ